MNAPANIRQPRAIRVDETPQEAAHRASISIHCPNQDEMQMAARVDIATIRDRASAGLSRANDSAAVLLAEIARVGTMAVYAPLPASKLLRIRAALQLTMEAARAMERALTDGR